MIYFLVAILLLAIILSLRMGRLIMKWGIIAVFVGGLALWGYINIVSEQHREEVERDAIYEAQTKAAQAQRADAERANAERAASLQASLALKVRQGMVAYLMNMKGNVLPLDYSVETVRQGFKEAFEQGTLDLAIGNARLDELSVARPNSSFSVSFGLRFVSPNPADATKPEAWVSVYDGSHPNAACFNQNQAVACIEEMRKAAKAANVPLIYGAVWDRYETGLLDAHPKQG